MVFNFDNPWIITIIGGGIAAFIGGYVLFYWKPIHDRMNNWIKERIDREKHIKIRYNTLNVNFLYNQIQKISFNEEAVDIAVVLPVNNSFKDDCVYDEKSATGAYCLRYYHPKKDKIFSDIDQVLKAENVKKCYDDLYPPATAIFLPDEYNVPVKCILVASTIRTEQKGIFTHPFIICESIRNIFKITANKKIKTIYIPILGSGHGGLDFNDSLLLMIISFKFYSKKYHHIKCVNLVINKKDKLDLTMINSLIR